MGSWSDGGKSEPKSRGVIRGGTAEARSRPLKALLTRKTIIFFGQVVQKEELVG